MVILNEPADVHLVKTIEGDDGRVRSGRARTFAFWRSWRPPC